MTFLANRLTFPATQQYAGVIADCAASAIRAVLPIVSFVNDYVEHPIEPGFDYRTGSAVLTMDTRWWLKLPTPSSLPRALGAFANQCLVRIEDIMPIETTRKIETICALGVRITAAEVKADGLHPDPSREDYYHITLLANGAASLDHGYRRIDSTYTLVSELSPEEQAEALQSLAAIMTTAASHPESTQLIAA